MNTKLQASQPVGFTVEVGGRVAELSCVGFRVQLPPEPKQLFFQHVMNAMGPLSVIALILITFIVNGL